MPYADKPTLMEFDDYPDGELLSLVRAGETSAYAGLYRRHRAAAIRFAQRFSDPEIAQDAVQDSFLKILKAVGNGGGPREEFAAYLMRTIRNDLTDRSRKLIPTSIEGVGDSAPTAPAVSEVVEDAFDHDQIATAFASLDQTWQKVLWLTEVERLPPREIAGYFRITPNAVSQLARRARRGLKAAWLQTHVPALQAHQECRATIDLLGAFASRQLSENRTESVRTHISDCTRCALAMAELNELTTRRRALLIPVVLSSPSLLAGLSEVLLAPDSRTMPERVERSSDIAPKEFSGSAVAVRTVLKPSRKVLTLLATGAAVAAVAVATFALRPPAEPENTAESTSQSPAVDDSASRADGSGDSRAEDDRTERFGGPEKPAADDLPSSSADERATGDRPIHREDSGTGTVPPPSQPGSEASADEAALIATDPSIPPKESEVPVVPIPTETPEPGPILAPPSIQGPQSGAYATPVTLTGAGEPGALVQIVDETGTDVGAATVASDGTWSRRVRPGLPDRNTRYSVTQKNESSESEVSELAKDYVYLAPEIAEPLNGSSSELVDIDGDGQPDAIFLILNLEQEQPYTVSIDGERTDFPQEPAGSTVEFAVPLSPGVHTIGIAYRDQADGTLGALRETTFTAFAP